MRNIQMAAISFRRGLEVATNIAIIVLAAVIVGNVLSSRLKPRQAPLAPPIGTLMSLTGVKWEENGSTLLMVLQKGCRYCEESASFYRKVYDQRAQRSQPRILAVVPGEKTETLRYLSERGVSVDDVVSSSLSDIKISATPTLVLIDHLGRVKNAWVGKLNENQEKEVLQQVLGS
jgi:hypothetical protein